MRGEAYAAGDHVIYFVGDAAEPGRVTETYRSHLCEVARIRLDSGRVVEAKTASSQVMHDIEC